MIISMAGVVKNCTGKSDTMGGSLIVVGAYVGTSAEGDRLSVGSVVGVDVGLTGSILSTSSLPPPSPSSFVG